MKFKLFNLLIELGWSKDGLWVAKHGDGSRQHHILDVSVISAKIDGVEQFGFQIIILKILIGFAFI